MSEERNELPRTLSTAIPAIPIPTESDKPSAAAETDARERIAGLEREARAMGPVPAAALLFHELGLLWEKPLHHARNAAVAYQQAFKLSPRFLANIRAARRLFSEVGNWAMAVTLIDAELAANEARRARAALLFEKSLILENRLSRRDEAAVALQRCLELPPEDVTLLVQLEQVLIEKGDFPALVKVYQLLADAVNEASAKAAYFTSAGLLLEARMQDFTEAARFFRQAFAIDRRDPQLLSAMKRVAQREGTIDEELAALAAEAEGQGTAAAPTFLQISKTYEKLGRMEDALSALLAARRVNPNDPLTLAELARIYESQGRFDELADVLQAWAGITTDENESVTINLRLAALYEQLRREKDAVASYEAILSRVPGHWGALAALGKLHHTAQNWLGLFETYETEAAVTDDARQKAGRVYKAGETLEERLDRLDDAIARYNQCLQLCPGYLPAQKALTRIYEKLNRWQDLVAMYEQDLLQTSDREQQVATLNKVAALYEDRLGQLDQAIDCLKRVLELSPDHPATMRNLARLYERASKWHELLELNDSEARVAGDTKQVVSLAHRNAEILEEQLGDRPAAILAWERVLQLSPLYLPALRALGRLYAQDGRWEALIKMHRTEADIAASPEQTANLIHKVGELFEQKLKDVDQAIAAYREVLVLAPTHGAALRSLGRIYRSLNRWESLIEILRAEAANRSDPTERANAFFQAAAIWEDQLDKPEAAIDAYQEVLRLAPNHATALQQLERLLTRKDDVKELIVLLDRQTQTGTDAARMGAWLKLARLYLDRINEPVRAATCCEAALTLEPANLTALRLLERIRANDKPRRTELRSRIANAIGDEKLAAAIRLSNVDAREANVTFAQNVLEDLKTTFLADPTDEALGLVLERALVRVGDTQGLIDLYGRRRAAATDSAELLQLQLRLGELYETRSIDILNALKAYEDAVRAAPDFYPALQGQLRCYQRLGDYIRSRATYEAIAKTAQDPATVLHALLEAAKLARDVERNEPAAEEILRKILERAPLHTEAGAALEELLERREGALDLAGLHEKRAEARLALKDTAGASRDFFVASDILFKRTQHRSEAKALLDRALMVTPSFIDALEMKGAIATEDQDYAEAAAAFAVRVQQGGDPKVLASFNLKLGALYHDHLSDTTRAAAHLQTALSADPTSIEALERLAQIQTLGRNWTGAADCMRRLLELELTSQARAKYTLALARITDEGFGDIGQAISLYSSALELVPGDPLTLDRLATLYERTGSLAELAATLEKQAKYGADAKSVIALRLRLAALYSRSLDNPTQAIATLRQVIEADPSQISAWTSLAELYQRDSGSITLAIEAHRSVLRLDPTRADSLHALVRLWEALRQMDKVFCAASLLVFLKQATDVETAFFTEARNRLSNDFKSALAPVDIAALHPQAAQHPIVDVLRAIGDQFVKLLPPRFDLLSMDRKADRLKPEHAIYRALQAVTSLWGLKEFEAYQAKRGLVFLETTEPLSVCVGPDVVRRFNSREQRFLYGRAAMGLFNKTAIVDKVSPGDLADILGNAVRIHQPMFDGLGRKSEEQSKQLRRAFSRKSLRLLEVPAHTAATTPPKIQVDPVIQGLKTAADRAGLVVCGDPSAGLNLKLKEEVGDSQVKPETSEAIAHVVHTHLELKELMIFSIDDDFFRLRQRIGVALVS